MKNFKKVGVGLFVVIILAVFSMVLVDPAAVSAQKLKDGTALGAFLGSVFTFALFGLIGFFLFSRSILAFCITAVIVALASSYQGYKERTEASQTKSLLSNTNTTTGTQSYGETQKEKLELAIKNQGLDAVMEDVIKEWHKNLPINMSNFDQIVATTYLPSRDMQIYKHVVPTDWESSIPKLAETLNIEGREAVLEHLKEYGIRAACTNSLMRQLMGHGLTIGHVYHDVSGIEILTFDIDNSRCVE